MPAAAPSPLLQGLIDKGLFERLPPTFSTFFFERIRDWALLFPAEQSYFERLFGMFDRSEPELVDQLFAPLRAVEARMGVNPRTWPTRQFTLANVDFLNRSPHYAEWRGVIGDIFSRIDPLLDQELVQFARPRLAIVTAPAELPTGPDRMWTRLAAKGRRVPLRLDAGEDLLGSLLTGGAGGSSLLELCAARDGAGQAWLIEAGQRRAAGAGRYTHLSYEALQPYRIRLMDEVRNMVQREDIRGPRQLGERLRAMSMPGGHADGVVADFVRTTLLNGNGTLLINNTFVEWASIQAVRRARPTVLVSSFGVRNKVKPFSSLLIYADQEKVTPVPTQTDTLGSYVDLEIFYQYLWQEFEKYVEYRGNTVYLFAGEGMDEMLVLGPAEFSLRTPAAPRDVHAALKGWLKL
ncbi:MAG: hypothetical protein FJW40_09100 [Acidobacteria bacterium]|nr:hypothetical protein [Acidobacteriota bacterium]